MPSNEYLPSAHSDATAPEPKVANLKARLSDVFSRTFDLGCTGFGGPAVHYQIFHRRFVDGMGQTPWIDEQTYQSVFALAQSLPGPASTKMLFLITQIHAGLIPAFMVFFLWTLPGASIMYGLSLGVQRMNKTLPDPACALLSGLNAATVGIVAFSAIQLARMAITDRLTRLLVLFGGCASLCYSALWYSPVLLVCAALTTLVWDTCAGPLGRKWRSIRRRSANHREPEAGIIDTTIPADIVPGAEHIGADSEPASASKGFSPANVSKPTVQDVATHALPAKIGFLIIGLFFATFAIVMTFRGVLHHPPLIFSLFNNMLLAGTIVFGGGSVIIALLRDYVVQPGWVSPRDFLLGLAVIQALPGPNSNFGVFLGALVLTGPASTKSIPTIFGGLLAFIGLFTPALSLAIGFQSLWQSSRKKRVVKSVVRGVTATAVGFVFTAVFRLWQNGYLRGAQNVSLSQEPWWLVVGATSFTVVAWFSVPPPAAILGGGIAGLCWWAAVKR